MPARSKATAAKAKPKRKRKPRVGPQAVWAVVPMQGKRKGRRVRVRSVAEGHKVTANVDGGYVVIAPLKEGDS